MKYLRDIDVAHDGSEEYIEKQRHDARLMVCSWVYDHLPKRHHKKVVEESAEHLLCLGLIEEEQ